MGKKAPKPPDPWETAAAQGQWNSFTAQQQQAMNMIGQNTPWGSLSYDQTGTQTIVGPDGKTYTIPKYTANTKLTPEQQAIFGQQQAAQGNMASLANEQSAKMRQYLQSGLDTSGFGQMQTTPGADYSTQVGGNYATSYAGADDFSADRQMYTDALMQRMAPQMQQDESRLRDQLINQGIRPGTAAWNSEQGRLSQGVNDARLGAILAGGQEQSRMVGMARDAAMFGNDAELSRMGAQNQASMAQAAFGNQARQQQLNEGLALRNQPINELTALMSGSQVQSPNSTFAQTPQTGVGGVDYSGLVQQNYQSQLAAHQAQMGGLFGLGGSLIGAGAMMFSDERLKTGIQRVGETGAGTPIYRYRYKAGGPMQLGVMAQEVEKTQPEAVARHPSGYLMVDYGKVR